jgi:hypothetical protein
VGILGVLGVPPAGSSSEQPAIAAPMIKALRKMAVRFI